MRAIQEPRQPRPSIAVCGTVPSIRFMSRRFVLYCRPLRFGSLGLSIILVSHLALGTRTELGISRTRHKVTLNILFSLEKPAASVGQGQ